MYLLWFEIATASGCFRHKKQPVSLDGPLWKSEALAHLCRDMEVHRGKRGLGHRERRAFRFCDRCCSLLTWVSCLPPAKRAGRIERERGNNTLPFSLRHAVLSTVSKIQF